MADFYKDSSDSNNVFVPKSMTMDTLMQFGLHKLLHFYAQLLIILSISSNSFQIYFLSYPDNKDTIYLDKKLEDLKDKLTSTRVDILANQFSSTDLIPIIIKNLLYYLINNRIIINKIIVIFNSKN